MVNVINATYDTLKKLGSGGSSEVYLAEQLRTRQKVAIKVDKRPLMTHWDAVAQEMNILRDLDHPYIPRLYDYIADTEQNKAYTVMEYIEGESLNQLLREKGRFPQAQVIDWACQILDALIYLHERHYLHGDIKPSNIMVDRNGDIRLIDFNIALNLQEKDAVFAQLSESYASPEHYGSEDPTMRIEVLQDANEAEETPTKRFRISGSEKMVRLDARSDIYNLGATLYHLLSGERPAKNAEEVKPLAKETASPAVAAIIEKAMAPDPDKRYQTAREMLSAFQRLPAADPRSRLRRWLGLSAAAATIAILAAGLYMIFAGQYQITRLRESAWNAERAYSSLQSGAYSEALQYALDASLTGPMDPPCTAQAQRALAKILGVYDLSTGYVPYLSISALKGKPVKTGLSPDGSKIAVLVEYTASASAEKQIQVFDARGGRELTKPLPANYSALSEFAFLDNDTLVYAGKDVMTVYDLKNDAPLWSGRLATGIALSDDGATVASVYRDESFAFLYDAAGTPLLLSFFGKRQTVLSHDIYADPLDSLFALDAKGEWLAVSFSDGGLRLYNVGDRAALGTPGSGMDYTDILETSSYTHFEGGFFGPFFAYAASSGRQGEEELSECKVINLDTRETVLERRESGIMHIEAHETGIYLSQGSRIFRVDPFTESWELLANAGGEISILQHAAGYLLAVTQNGRFTIYSENGSWEEAHASEVAIDFAALAGPYLLLANRENTTLSLLQWRQHPDAQILTYDPQYQHLYAFLHTDGATAMLFRARNFRIYDMDGRTVSRTTFSDWNDVINQKYLRRPETPEDPEEECLKVIYPQRVDYYSAKTGDLILTRPPSQADTAEPENRLVFDTDSYRVEYQMNGPVDIYQKDGKFLKRLEADNITYAEQRGDNLILGFISNAMKQYGLLVDRNGEVIADLPDLCGILPDGTLAFDDNQGRLMKGRIYSLEELIAMAQDRRNAIW